MQIGNKFRPLTLTLYLTYVFLASMSNLATPYLADKVFGGHMYLYGFLTSLGNVLRVLFRFVSAGLIRLLSIPFTLMLIIMFASFNRIVLFLTWHVDDVVLSIILFTVSIVVAAFYRSLQGYVVPVVLRRHQYFRAFWFFTLSSVESILIALAPIVSSLIVVVLIKGVENLFMLSALSLLALAPIAARLESYENSISTAKRIRLLDALRVEKPPRHLYLLLLCVGIDVFAWSIFLPYLYIYLVAKGFHVIDVALSMASFYAPSIIMPLLGYLLDTVGRGSVASHVLLLVGAQVMGIAGLTLLMYSPQIYIVTFLLIGLATTMTSPLMQSLLNVLTRDGEEKEYVNILAWWRNISSIVGIVGSTFGGILFLNHDVFFKTSVLLLSIALTAYTALMISLSRPKR